MSTLVDLAHLPITVSGGVPLDCLTIFQNVFDIPLFVLFIVSNIHLILTVYLTNIVDHPCVPGSNGGQLLDMEGLMRLGHWKAY